MIGPMSSCNENLFDTISPSDELVLKERMIFAKRGMKDIEQQFSEYTRRFYEARNAYGVKYVTGISSSIFINSEFGEDFYINLIMGCRGRENDEKIDEETMFDVASITKLFTLIVLLKLEELNVLSLNEKICDINEDFQNLEDFTLNDLMRLHGKYWTDGNITKASSKEEAQRILKTLHLTDNTRDENTYNDFCSIVIADTIEKRVSKILGYKVTYAEVLDRILLKPLNMNNTGYNPKTDNVSGNGPGTNVVHDPKARMLGGECGHAGLFTNCYDMKLLAKDIFNAKTGKSIVISKKMLDKMSEITFKNSARASKGNMGIYVKNKDATDTTYVPECYMEGSFAGQGWTGSVASFDPNCEVHQSILVNAIYTSDNEEEIKNNKPIGFKDEFKRYQEITATLAKKYSMLKGQYEFCKFVLANKPMSLKKAYN